MRGILFSILILMLISCDRNIEFNSEIWKKSGGENLTLDTRSRMIKNLIGSKILQEKSEQQIIKLIGEPSRINTRNIDSIKYFQVQEIYNWNIDPDELIFLKITFDSNHISKKIEKFKTK